MISFAVYILWLGNLCYGICCRRKSSNSSQIHKLYSRYHNPEQLVCNDTGWMETNLLHIERLEWKRYCLSSLNLFGFYILGRTLSDIHLSHLTARSKYKDISIATQDWSSCKVLYNLVHRECMIGSHRGSCRCSWKSSRWRPWWGWWWLMAHRVNLANRNCLHL